MARKKTSEPIASEEFLTTIQPLAEETPSIESLFEAADQTVDKSVLPETADDDKDAELPPPTHAPEWTSFIMSRLLEDEIFDGCPKVDGLRRVTELYYGNVIGSISDVAQAPSAQNGHHACVSHTLTIQCHDGVLRSFSGVADVFRGNGEDSFGWRFAAATCETRAESRAYRRALKLRGVTTAEEMSQIPEDESGIDGRIQNSQKNYLDILCKRCNIDVMKYVSSGKKQYAAIDDVPYDTAQKMCSQLSVLQGDMSQISESMKGYKQGWQTKGE